MQTGSQLVWFRIRPLLHKALTERAAQHGLQLEHEMINILEAAIRPRRLPRTRHRLRLLPTGEPEEAS